MYVIQKLVPPGQGIRGPKKYAVLTPRGICWHWTANPHKGAGATAHWIYWHRATVGAHYVVSSKGIIHAVPDNEVVWHAGGGDRTRYIIDRLNNVRPNYCLIGVEMCVNSDGNWEETYKRSVYLGAVKCIEYGWDPHKDFYRHYDCTHKDCPRMWTPYVPGGDEVWDRFKNDVAKEIKRMEGKAMPEKWKVDIMDKAKKEGLIMGDHNPDDKATKWFVLAVALNLLKIVRGK